MKNLNTFCVNPYLNLNVHPRGVVKPCCMSNKEYTTDDQKNRLNQTSIMKFWNSNDRLKFIKDLDSGIKVKECDSCWKEEESGKESKRIRDNRTFQNQSIDENMLPLVIDLSMGNLCNLKCRICSPIHSSQWMNEEARIHFPNDKIKYFKEERWKTSKESFDETNAYFWEDIISLLPNVVKFDFAGGEPFYIEKHWDIIKSVVENGWSVNQHVHYNTNGTIYPEKYIDLLEQFKIVDIQISSDGVGRKFEYMRHPANWDLVEKNIQKFCEAKNNSSTTWWLGMCISVSAFNVYDFFETFEHYSSKDLSIYVNVVHDHHSIKVLPDDVKDQIIKKLSQCKSKYNQSQWEKESSMIINYLKNSVYNLYDWNNFIKELKMRDNLRNESFEKTFPEYYQVLKEYF